MEDATIPGALLESKEYAGLTDSQKFFLIDLYITRGDCESFTIDGGIIGGYSQERTTIFRRIRSLLEAGLLDAKLKYDNKAGPPERIYSFKYKVQ